MLARMAKDCLVFVCFALVAIFAYGFATQAVLDSAATASTPRRFSVDQLSPSASPIHFCKRKC
jgi:hypothetical protein